MHTLIDYMLVNIPPRVAMTQYPIGLIGLQLAVDGFCYLSIDDWPVMRQFNCFLLVSRLHLELDH